MNMTRRKSASDSTRGQAEYEVDRKESRKEQCLALRKRLRSKYKIKYQFIRVFPNGEVQYLQPKDGVYPEKVKAGQQGVRQIMRSIGKNVSPIEVKFTRK
ncbi:photosystem I reaction center subunit II, chloroplastic-like protein [Tanacetum coccineum]